MLSKTHSKYIQGLHHKKFRDADQAFIAEGSKVVMELLNSPSFLCQEIFGLQEWLHQNEIEIRGRYSGPLNVVEDFELKKISALATPNQVLAVFRKAQPALVNPQQKITLVLDTIQDPGNLGTIIRIADWFGVTAIVCSPDCADMYNPKVVQSTMGSLGRVALIYTPLAQWLYQYKSIPTFAAALNGKQVGELKGLQEGIIVIGNESKGISAEIMQLCTQKITIPRMGMAESLNAAVATGIILSHL